MEEPGSTASAGSFSHVSVLLAEAVDGLAVKPGGVYVDGTLGGGGHSEEILRRLAGTGRLIGIDRDEEALEAAGRRLAGAGNLTLIHGNFGSLREILRGLEIEAVDGILLDLGVSSHQFDAAERGFSYRADAPLDMRMDRSGGITAAEVVNTYSEAELARILRDYGEEPFARSIAKNIVRRRAEKPVETTLELAEIIRDSIPMKARRTGGHPARRSFQAIRIEVNGELTVLEETIGDLIDLLAPGGRLSVITFHSLEDRIVKNKFKEAEDPCICPKDFPVCVCGRKSKGRAVTRKPVLPAEAEAERNPRARSAKLRVFERNHGEHT